MESGDGLLVRVRARHGARGIRASELRAVAQLAAAHGNGLLEVTRRARLQVRGVRADSLGALQHSIVELGLAADSAALEQSADALIVTPWSGLSPACADLDATAAALESALAQARACEGASSKLGILLDSGYALVSIAADIHVDIDAQSSERARIHVSSGPEAWSYLGDCDVADVAKLVVALLSALRESSTCERVRELVAAVGLNALRELARGSARSFEAASAKEVKLPRRQQNAKRRQGSSADTDHRICSMGASSAAGSPAWLEFGLPFGSGDRATWGALASIAERYGSSEIRVTPSRTALVPGVERAQLAAALELAEATGWITDPSDPLLRVAACPGAPACRSAAGETRTLARELAPLLGANESLHVSGCAKGCAHGGPASITVVRRADGCSLGFGLSAAQTAEADRQALPELRATLVRRSAPAHARTLARDPSTVHARELR